MAHLGQALTSREGVILVMVAEGALTKHISASLGITGATVRNHRVSIRQKLGALTPAHMIAIAFRKGLLK